MKIQMRGSAMRKLTPPEQTEYRHLLINARAQWLGGTVIISAFVWMLPLQYWVAFGVVCILHVANSVLTYRAVNRFQVEHEAPEQPWQPSDSR